jgi:hypothetical protein
MWARASRSCKPYFNKIQSVPHPSYAWAGFLTGVSERLFGLLWARGFHDASSLKASGFQPFQELAEFQALAGQWQEAGEKEPGRRLHFRRRKQFLLLLEHSPHKMREQEEEQQHECSNPDQEVFGQLWGFDFFLVHGTSIRFLSLLPALPRFAQRGSQGHRSPRGS